MGAESAPGCQHLFSALKLGETSTAMTMALISYYGSLGCGVYPWETGHNSEHINDKDNP